MEEKFYESMKFINLAKIFIQQLFFNYHRDGSIKLFRNLGACILIYTASYPKRLEMLWLELSENQTLVFLYILKINAFLLFCYCFCYNCYFCCCCCWWWCSWDLWFHPRF